MKRTKSMYVKKTAESEELFWFAASNDFLYRSAIQPVIQNLKKKVDKGIYDADKALDLWYVVATTAADLYKKKFGGYFDVTSRFTVAAGLAEEYAEELEE